MVYCFHETESCCHVVRGQAARAAPLLDLFGGSIEVLSPLPASTNNECMLKEREKNEKKDIIRRSKASMSPITFPSCCSV